MNDLAFSCVKMFLSLTLCQSGVSSPIICLRSCSFFFFLASSTWSNCFWAEINNGLELILVNCPGLAAGLLAMIPDVLVGINSWSCKIFMKKTNNNCDRGALMFSRQNLRLVCVAGSQIGDSQSRRLWIDCPPNYLRCCICNLASLSSHQGSFIH